MMYFISYDIADPKRLKAVAKMLENYGLRIQKSFFQCEVSEKIKKNLVGDLLSIINENEDSLIVTPICSKCLNQVIPMGLGEFFEVETFQIL